MFNSLSHPTKFFAFRYWALLLCASLILSACASPATPISPAPASTRLQQIQKAGKVVIGTAITAPFEYRDSQTGKLIGLDVDVATTIASKLGVPIEWQEMAFADLLPTLQSGKVDLVIAGMYITAARQEVVDMSDGYIETGLVILTRADNSAIKTPLDLTNKKLGVKTGSTGAVYAQKLKTGGQTIAIQEYADTVKSLEDLSANIVEAVFNDKVNSLQYIKTHKDLKVASEIIDPAQLGIAVRKGDSDLLALINSTLREMKTNKSLDTLYNKWIAGQ